MAEERMPADGVRATNWLLSADRATVRLQLPPLNVAGVPKPLNIHIDFDAEAVDAMIEELLDLRAKMVPPAERH